MSLYSDQEKKIEYYRSRITQELARQGIYPNDARISAQLSNIDTMLGIFQYMNVGIGEEFDTAKFNEDMLRIWEDLKILYQLAYEITVKDYEELQLWAEIKIAELQSMAAKYEYKDKIEFGSTYLGNTIFYQSTNYDISSKDGIVTVKLGTIEPEAQSKLFCIFDCDQVLLQNIVFTFKNVDTGTVSNCSAYSYNHDYFIVPGELKKKSYRVTLNGETIRTSFICTPESLSGSVNRNNKYKLFGGYGQVSLGYQAKEYVTKMPDIPIELTNGGIATFYIIDGSFADFSFSSEPDNKNFEGISVTNFKHCKKIVIEHKSFLSFDFNTDGTIYATCQDGQVINNEIIYPAADKINDILVEEYSVGNKIPYEVTVTAGPLYSGNIPDIKAIAIKQLSSLEEVTS